MTLAYRTQQAGSSSERTLLHIPIVHTLADMGGMGEAFATAAAHQLGSAAWRQHVEAIENFWDQIERAVHSLEIPPSQMRLYQDSLPVCGKEHQIVEEVIRTTDSRNYQLLQDLIQQGATLTGTESGPLLVQEMEIAKTRLTAGTPTTPRARAEAAKNEERAKHLLSERDRFIAEQIKNTLHKEELGLLFLGALHNPFPFLATDIRVLRLASEQVEEQKR